MDLLAFFFVQKGTSLGNNSLGDDLVQGIA